jgi:hypothetical protein
MANNHLEQLIAEWYEYRGFFVRRNVNVGKRPNGGYACELDVVAFHPGERRLVHIEPSLDADSWERREERYANKFEMGRKHIPGLFAGLELPSDIEQYAVLVFASGKKVKTLGGAPIVLAGHLIEEILVGLRHKRLAKSAVPEQFPLLRTLQYVAEYREHAVKALSVPTVAT